MGNVNCYLPNTECIPNRKLQQMDYLLSAYYQLKGLTYYNDDVGLFSQWCIDNGHDIDSISNELKQLPGQCCLIQFDPHFPKKNNIDANDRKNEIFQVLRHCWHHPNEFYVNIIQKKRPVPNTYILSLIIQKQQLLLHGYCGQNNIPTDIINICCLYFVINKQTLCTDIHPKLWKPKTVTQDIALCYLAVTNFIKNHEYFISYQIISMILNNYEYHNHSNQTKAQLHANRAIVSLKWNSLNNAENDMKIATDLHAKCGYIHGYINILLQRGKYEEALKQSLKAIKLDRFNVTSRAWCATVYEAMNDLDNAIIYCLKCVDLEPNKAKYAFKCAKIYSKLNDYYNTKMYCLQAIEQDPMSSKYYFRSAEVLKHFKTNNEADKYYMKAIELDPRKTKYRLYYGLFLKSQHKYDDALREFMTAMDFTTTDKGDGDCLVQCAFLYEELNDFNNAKAYFLKAIQIDSPSKPKYIYHYGMFLRYQAKYSEALDQFILAMKLTQCIKKKAECAFSCALCYGELKDCENERKYYLNAINADPQNAKYRYLYGLSLSVQQKYEDALQECLEAIDLDGLNADYVIHSAYCFEKLHDCDNATKYYLRAIALNKGKNAEYYALYGKYICTELKNREQAELYLSKAIKMDSQNDKIYYYYARCLRDYWRDYAESEIYYQKCLQINDKNYNGSYGYLLYLMGKYDISFKYIQIELDLDDANHWAHYYFGLVNNKLGNKKQAIESMHRALDLCTNIKEMEEGIDIMKKSDTDSQSIAYHQRFAELINTKFKCYNCGQ